MIGGEPDVAWSPLFFPFELQWISSYISLLYRDITRAKILGLSLLISFVFIASRLHLAHATTHLMITHRWVVLIRYGGIQLWRTSVVNLRMLIRVGPRPALHQLVRASFHRGGAHIYSVFLFNIARLCAIHQVYLLLKDMCGIYEGRRSSTRLKGIGEYLGI